MLSQEEKEPLIYFKASLAALKAKGWEKGNFLRTIQIWMVYTHSLALNKLCLSYFQIYENLDK